MKSLAMQNARLLERAPISIRPFGPCHRCQRQLSSTGNIHNQIQSSRRNSSPAQHRPYSNTSPTLSQETTRVRTYYDLFPQSLPQGPPPRGPFHVDTRQLRREFLQLQSGAHPDRHPASARIKAEAMSTYINEAYKMLQSPLSRAQYLLSLRGVATAEDETAKVNDPELLTQVLEIRELMEEAEEEGDLKKLKEENDQRILMAVEELGRAFEKDDIERAKETTIRLRYWVNIRESLDGWEPGKPVVMHH